MGSSEERGLDAPGGLEEESDGKDMLKGGAERGEKGGEKGEVEKAMKRVEEDFILVSLSDRDPTGEIVDRFESPSELKIDANGENKEKKMKDSPLMDMKPNLSSSSPSAPTPKNSVFETMPRMEGLPIAEQDSVEESLVKRNSFGNTVDENSSAGDELSDEQEVAALRWADLGTSADVLKAEAFDLGVDLRGEIGLEVHSANELRSQKGADEGEKDNSATYSFEEETEKGLSGEEEMKLTANQQDGFLKPDHPALARVQNALQKELKKQNDRLTNLLAVREEEYKNLYRNREASGVDLYNAQKELSSLQLSLDKLERKLAVRSEENAELKRKADEAEMEHRTIQEKAEKAVQEFFELQKENNRRSALVRESEKEVMKSEKELKLVKMGTYKGEEILTKAEDEKLRQDLAIEQITQNIRALEEELTYYEPQIEAQKKESEIAENVLQEANREVTTLEMENTQLNQQWKRTLRGVQKRDEGTNLATKALEDQEKKLKELNTEIRDFEVQTKNAQNMNETLTSKKSNALHDLRTAEKNLKLIQIEKERIWEEKNLLTNSLELTKNDSKKLQHAIFSLENQARLAEDNIQKISRENNEISDEMFKIIGSRKSLSRSAAQAHKMVKKLRNQMATHEEELAAVQNQLAGVNVESLNTKARIDLLKSKSNKLLQTLADKENDHDNLLTELRRQESVISKAQGLLDRLNKEFDQRKSKLEHFNAGPMEMKISNLERSTSALRKECVELQEKWIKTQKALLKKTAKVSNLDKKIWESQNLRLVLNQKRLRLEKDRENASKVVGEITQKVKDLRGHITRFNGMILDNEEKKKRVLGLKSKLLEDIETKSVSYKSQLGNIAGQIERTISEKEEKSNSLLDLNGQLLLWEKKVSLEKEMQLTLNPHDSEAVQMQDEIHRMKLKYDNLKKNEEKLLCDIETAIGKQDMIGLKGRSGYIKEGAYDNAHRVARQAETLSRKLKKNILLLDESEEELRQLQDDIEQTKTQILAEQNDTQEQVVFLFQLSRGQLLASVEKAQLAVQALQFQRLNKVYLHKTSSKTSTPHNLSAASSSTTATSISTAKLRILEKEKTNKTKILSVIGEIEKVVPDPPAPHCAISKKLFSYFAKWLDQNSIFDPELIQRKKSPKIKSTNK